MNYRTLLYLIAAIACTQALHGMQSPHGDDSDFNLFVRRKVLVMADKIYLRRQQIKEEETALCNQFRALTLGDPDSSHGKHNIGGSKQQNSRKRYKLEEEEDDTIVEDDTSDND